MSNQFSIFSILISLVDNVPQRLAQGMGTRTDQGAKPAASLGFTLVELLIAMGLLASLLMILTNIFVTTLEVQLRSQTISALQQDSDYLLARLQYDVYRADSIISPANVGDETDNLVLEIDGSTWTWQVIDGVLSMSDGSQELVVHSDRVQLSDFTLQRVGNPGGGEWIQVSFILDSRVESSASEQQRVFTTTIGVR